MKQFKSVLVTFLSIILIVFVVSCKKSESFTNSNPTTSDMGSGSISFNTSTKGNISMNGAWTGSAVGSSGTAVAAVTGHDGADYGAIIYGYAWHSSTNWDYVWLDIATTGGPLTTGTYSVGADNKELAFEFSKGGSSPTDASNVYYLMSGSCNLTNYSSTGMKGTFSGTAVHYNATGTEDSTFVTNGSFDVTFGDINAFTQ
jgi:hypothetical protein